uniref:C-type lectin domain-containing protein n=1 Tax=Panagrellus redivivus TaxID=6233 RepID=A0A7E4WDH5_PANRE
MTKEAMLQLMGRKGSTQAGSDRHCVSTNMGQDGFEPFSAVKYPQNKQQISLSGTSEDHGTGMLHLDGCRVDSSAVRSYKSEMELVGSIVVGHLLTDGDRYSLKAWMSLGWGCVGKRGGSKTPGETQQKAGEKKHCPIENGNWGYGWNDGIEACRQAGVDA